MYMDQEAITAMVEDFWRGFMRASFNGKKAEAVAMVGRFDQQLKEVRSILPASEVEPFDEMVEAEREKLFREYNANPEALRRRLGTGTSDRGATPGRSRMGLGEVAARTAVRATVWDTIGSIFRAFRG